MASTATREDESSQQVDSDESGGPSMQYIMKRAERMGREVGRVTVSVQPSERCHFQTEGKAVVGVESSQGVRQGKDLRMPNERGIVRVLLSVRKTGWGECWGMRT